MDESRSNHVYVVYMLRCADGTLYTGCTSDMEKRLFAHNHLKTGAKYTRARRPVEVVYREEVSDRAEAQKREWYIKSLSRLQKEGLVLEFQKGTC